jgi:hydrogenase nickel incorporation protein HypA/HybF
MHEYGIIQSLLQRVDAEARSHGATSVHRVVLRLGEISGVEPDLLGFAFEAYREGTVAAAAELSINFVPARWECSLCKATLPRGGYLRCEPCDAPARLAEGDDIILERLEMEVPDVS